MQRQLPQALSQGPCPVLTEKEPREGTWVLHLLARGSCRPQGAWPTREGVGEAGLCESQCSSPLLMETGLPSSETPLSHTNSGRHLSASWFISGVVGAHSIHTPPLSARLRAGHGPQSDHGQRECAGVTDPCLCDRGSMSVHTFVSTGECLRGPTRSRAAVGVRTLCVRMYTDGWMTDTVCVWGGCPVCA